MDAYTCMAVSPLCPPETITTLLIDYDQLIISYLLVNYLVNYQLIIYDVTYIHLCPNTR